MERLLIAGLKKRLCIKWIDTSLDGIEVLKEMLKSN